MKSANDGSFTCKTFKKTIRAYIDNELSGSVKAEFIAHESQCRECSRALGEMEGIVNLLAGLKPVTTSGEFDISLKTRILLEKDRFSSLFYRFSLFFRDNLRYIVAVPAFALALTTAVFFLFHDGNPLKTMAGNVSPVEDVLNESDLITQDENIPDEIVYVYYVLETVRTSGSEKELTGENSRSTNRVQMANSAFKTVSF